METSAGIALQFHRAHHVLAARDEWNGGIGMGNPCYQVLADPCDRTIRFELINVIPIDTFRRCGPGERYMAIHIIHLQCGGWCHHAHAQTWITHQCQMDARDIATLPPIILRGVQAGIIHCDQCAVPDVLSKAHMMEVPWWHAGPAIGERFTFGDGCAQKVVLVVPVAEIATQRHVEHPPHACVRRVVLGGADVAGPIEGDHAIHPLLASAAARIGP